MVLNHKQYIELDYPSSLHQFYQKFSSLPGFVLLESGDHLQGRYDILSAYPYDRIVIKEETEDKAALLYELKQKIVMEHSELDLPFQGGAIGYVAYDLGARLKGITSLTQTSLENMPLLDMGLYDWALIVDHHLKKVTLFAANRHDATNALCEEIKNIWYSSSPKDKNFQIKSDFKALIKKDNYLKSFQAVHQALKEGRSYQVNLTQAFHADYEGNSWEIYKKISSKNPVPFASFIKTEEASILSFSPERFLSGDKQTLFTSPIKGTIRRSPIKSEDEQLKNQLRHCAKNRAENVMIVDLLRNDLGKIAKPGTVRVTNLCAIQSYNFVHHLVSDIEAECVEGLHPLDAFISCFPGGSITGAPKLEAMRIINEEEPYGRGVYCGSIGYFSQHGRFDTNIAIRTITAKNNLLHLAAGGGIVIDSDCEDEYLECYTKIAAIIDGLN